MHYLEFPLKEMNVGAKLDIGKKKMSSHKKIEEVLLSLKSPTIYINTPGNADENGISLGDNVGSMPPCSVVVSSYTPYMKMLCKHKPEAFSSVKTLIVKAISLDALNDIRRALPHVNVIPVPEDICLKTPYYTDAGLALFLIKHVAKLTPRFSPNDGSYETYVAKNKSMYEAHALSKELTFELNR